MLSSEEIIRKIEQHREEVKSFGATKLTLIGSYARGESKGDSDIDFLVEFAPGRGLYDDFVHLYQFLCDLFGKEIDLGEPRLLREELRENILGGAQVEAKI